MNSTTPEYTNDAIDGDTVELVAPIPMFPSLRAEQKGKVKGICYGYCYWVKFHNYDPLDEPSKEWGFPIYFDEVRKVTN